MKVHFDFTIKIELFPPQFSHSHKCVRIKKRSKFNMYNGRTVRSILHLNQIKLKVDKALVINALNCIRSLTYITAYTVKTLLNLSGTERTQAGSSNNDRKMVLQVCCLVGFVSFFNSTTLTLQDS